MIWGISLILLSILAVPSLLLSKKPNAKELLEKVEPYQGWIGLIFCFWGIWGIIFAILNLEWLTTYPPIWWISVLAGNLISATLGFMLGFGVINNFFLSKNEEAKEKADLLRSKLAPKQGRLGFFGLILGGWVIVVSFLFYV